MKFLKYLNEKRRNPELNQKIKGTSIIEKYKDRKDVFVTYTNIQKFGINPNNAYNTPTGLYSKNISTDDKI